MKKMWDTLKKKKYFKMIVGLLVVLLVGWIVYLLFIRGMLQFYKNEQIFLDGVKKYYEYNPTKLPDNGGYREVQLSTMFRESWVESIFVPGKNRLCDGDSYIRVINENDTYRYITYLKCGKYETKVDHSAPEIVLNGDDTVVLHLNDEYKDAGIKEVKDNRDKIDLSSVQVDSSKVDTGKMGTYEVTYRVRDNSYNYATQKRTVVVAETLSARLQREKGASYAFTGGADDNYVMFSGMTWRILKLDGDGNIALITDNNISNVAYGVSGATYPESNVYKWLNEYFYSNLNENSKQYILDYKWCYDTVSSVEGAGACDSSVNAKVGLLSLADYERAKVDNRSYLVNSSRFYMINKQSSEQVWYTDIYEDSALLTGNIQNLYGVRPVIYISKDVFTTMGDGTFDNPYKLQDYTYAKENDSLNSRLIGEYVVYSGYLFRIAGVDENQNTRLVGVNLLKSTNDKKYATVGYAADSSSFTPDISKEGNLYYGLSHEAMNYISETSLVSREFEVPVYERGKNFDEYEKKKVTSKLGLPASYEMFSGYNRMSGDPVVYWLSDYNDDGTTTVINGDNGIAFYVRFDTFSKNAVKPVIYVQKDLKIASGKGTFSAPYYVR